MRDEIQIQFTEIASIIREARTNAIRAVNTELINLYWKIGEYISRRVEQSQWGESIVTELALYLSRTIPDAKGFSDKNL